MAAAVKILSATVDRGLADQLRRGLGKSDGVVLLLTPALARDANKNDVARSALVALALGRLVVVQIDGAEPPIGLRDIQALPWTPAGGDSGAQIAAISAQVKALPPAPKVKRRRSNLLAIGAILVLIAILVLLFALPVQLQSASELDGAETAAQREPGSIVFLMLGVLYLLLLPLAVVLQIFTLRAVGRLSRGGAARDRSHEKALATSQAPDGGGGLFFASYSRKDRDRVDEIIGAIQREGLPVWLDRIDIGGGATWPEAIVQAIRGARAVIVFCSSNAFDSDNVLREVNLAANYEKPLLPILLEPASVPDSFFYYLSTRQIIDLSSDADWRAKVLSSLKRAA